MIFQSNTKEVNNKPVFQSNKDTKLALLCIIIDFMHVMATNSTAMEKLNFIYIFIYLSVQNAKEHNDRNVEIVFILF